VSKLKNEVILLRDSLTFTHPLTASEIATWKANIDCIDHQITDIYNDLTEIIQG